MNILITGGAGFIGRWVVKGFLEDGNNIWVFDDLSNGSRKNISEFVKNPSFRDLIVGDVRNEQKLSYLFKNEIDVCIHLAAQINVQESIDDPEKSLSVNVNGTYKVLENARRDDVKVVLVSTCMVYDLATTAAIDENHPTKPASPYAAGKLAAEHIGLSYYHTYGLPVVVLRPFNTYGPFQKSNMEGGVVSIFINNDIRGRPLNIYGDGTQTRDFLYVEDCSDFILKATKSEKAVGETINAGYGKDVSINDLATLIASDRRRIRHAPHIHPQAEIQKLLCDCSKAKKLLGWEPTTTLEMGIKKTREWLRNES